MTEVRWTLTLSALLLLAACARDAPPAPVVTGTPAPPPAPSGPSELESGGGTVTVQKGQTLYAVSRAANVPVRTLIDANNLQPPFALKTGQVLTIPRIRQHIVQPGETLYSVSRRYNVEASTLAQLNHLPPPYTVKTGVPLQLPPPAEPQVAAVPTPPPGPVSATPLAPPILTPAPAATPVPAAVPTPIPVPTAAPTPIPSPVPAAAPAKPPAPVEKPAAPAETETAAAVPPAPPPPPPPPSVAQIVANHRAPSDPLFLWPVRGQIIAVFGPAPGGTSNDGVNIAAPQGTAVSAAENGVVAYAGNELRGFGNLLLIKHDDGWVTAYAHNDVLLVKKGDKVRRGQAIARVGNSGGVGEPQLHFELRHGTKAIDPLDHLPQLTG